MARRSVTLLYVIATVALFVYCATGPEGSENRNSETRSFPSGSSSEKSKSVESGVVTGRVKIWENDPFALESITFYPNLTQSWTREVRLYSLYGCDKPKRAIYLPDWKHNSVTRGVGDRIIRLLSLAGLAGHIHAVVLPPKPFLFVGHKHNAKIDQNASWSDFINLDRIHEKIRERTGWNPCGGIIQERLIISKRYPLIVHAGTPRIAQWEREYFNKRKLSPHKKKPLAVVVARVVDAAFLDQYQRWFNPFVEKVKGIFWYENAGQLVHAVHSGAFPVSKRIVQAAIKAAGIIAPSSSRFLVSLKLRRGDMVDLLGEEAINCTKVDSLVQKFTAVMKARFAAAIHMAQQASLGFCIFIMSNEQDESYLERFRERLLQLEYVTSVHFESDIRPFARMKKQKDDVGIYLAALQLHRIASIRLVTFRHEVFEDENIFSSPSEGVIPASVPIALCPDILRNGRKSLNKTEYSDS